MVQCKVCGKDFASERGLHVHIKAHKLGVEQYYHKFFPRTDRLTGKLIPFKDKEQYFKAEFASRASLAEYFESSREDVVNLACRLLKDRIESKNLKFAPSFVELKTSMVPSVHYFRKFCGGYGKTCRIIKPDIIVRFPKSGKNVFSHLPHKHLILAEDTREQQPLHFNCPVKSHKLDFGDYTAFGEAYADLFIERKSLADFISTMSLGYDRFNNEIDRAGDFNAYMVVVVEAPLCHALNFKEHVAKAEKRKATPDFIFHRVREMMQKYPSLQFLFVKNREESCRVIPKILLAGEEAKKVDLQYAYALGEL